MKGLAIPSFCQLGFEEMFLKIVSFVKINPVGVKTVQSLQNRFFPETFISMTMAFA